MGNTGIGTGLMEIASALLAIALIALLINKADNTSKLISTGTSAFDELLRTVTLQNSSAISNGMQFSF